MKQDESRLFRMSVGQNIVKELSKLLPTEINTHRIIDHNDLMGTPTKDCQVFINKLNEVSEGKIFLLTFESEMEEIKRALISLMALIGMVLQVEKRDNSFWYSLGVDLMADPNAGNGIGENPFHIDMLTFSHFPLGMTILCERPDSKNGGSTLLSDLGVHSKLPQKYADVLRKKRFTYWKDEGLEQVGQHLTTFSILPARESSRVRFTSKLSKWFNLHPNLKLNQREVLIHAIMQYETLLKRNQIIISLESSQALIFSQLHYAHGRTALGEGQIEVNPSLSRQLWRAYFNYANI